MPVGENLILSASFNKDGEDPPGVSTGILSLYHGDRKVGEGRIKTQPGMFPLAGEGLCVGRDSGELHYRGPQQRVLQGGHARGDAGVGDAYRAAMAAFAQMGTIDIWYAHLDEDELVSAVRNTVAETGKEAKGAKKKLEKRDVKEEKLAKLAEKRAEETRAKAHTRDSL